MTPRNETTKEEETRRWRNNHISAFWPAFQMHRWQIRAEIFKDQTNYQARQKGPHHCRLQRNHRGLLFLLGPGAGNGLTGVASMDRIGWVCHLQRYCLIVIYRVLQACTCLCLLSHRRFDTTLAIWRTTFETFLPGICGHVVKNCFQLLAFPVQYHL